jgi:hypothetical protein
MFVYLRRACVSVMTNTSFALFHSINISTNQSTRRDHVECGQLFAAQVERVQLRLTRRKLLFSSPKKHSTCSVQQSTCMERNLLQAEGVDAGSKSTQFSTT